MERLRQKRGLIRLCLGAVACAAAVSGLFWVLSVGVVQALRPLAGRLTEGETVLRALETLQGAAVWPPLWWTALAGVLLFGCGVLCRRAWRREPRRRVQAVLWGAAIPLFALVSFAISLWMTRVNSIPVHTMAAVLWKYMASGALSGL